jgi:hypothetical protein
MHNVPGVGPGVLVVLVVGKSAAAPSTMYTRSPAWTLRDSPCSEKQTTTGRQRENEKKQSGDDEVNGRGKHNVQ